MEVKTMKPEQIKTISIAKDFSAYPAGRFLEDGEASGTAFRDNLLIPALNGGFDKVEIIFDGVAGVGSSFLEEAFGGLIRKTGMSKTDLDQRLDLKTNEPDLEDFVRLAHRYIEDATKVTAT